MDIVSSYNKKYYVIHEELESLRHLDPDIKETYDQILMQTIGAFIQKCPALFAALPNARERIYLAIQILENFTHTQLEETSSCQFDMEQMRCLTIQTIENLLTQNR